MEQQTLSKTTIEETAVTRKNYGKSYTRQKRYRSRQTVAKVLRKLQMLVNEGQLDFSIVCKLPYSSSGGHMLIQTCSTGFQKEMLPNETIEQFNQRKRDESTIISQVITSNVAPEGSLTASRTPVKYGDEIDREFIVNVYKKDLQCTQVGDLSLVPEHSPKSDT